MCVFVGTEIVREIIHSDPFSDASVPTKIHGFTEFMLMCTDFSCKDVIIGHFHVLKCNHAKRPSEAQF